jgi:membrane-associated phospholipid phosphatase
LTLFFLAGLFLLVLLFRDQIPLWRSLLFRYAVWTGLLFAFQLVSQQRRAGHLGSFLYDFSPILFVVLIYESLGDLIQYLRPDIDPCLIRIDHFLFGVHPTVWAERWITPWLTDLMSFFYGSYYFVPVILIVALYFRGQRQDFDRAIFVLLFGYYISYIGYIVFPAIGPRFTISSLQTVPLEGSFLTDFVRDTLNQLEHNRRDCMPSGHTQLSLITLYLAYHYRRSLLPLLTPLVAGLIVSTIYLRYHYVIDIFAGVAVAIACVIMAPPLYEMWVASRRIRSDSCHARERVSGPEGVATNKERLLPRRRDGEAAG